MDKLIGILDELNIPYAYDHFAEGEAPSPPFICYTIPASDNFAADGKAYFKINEINIEVYTDKKELDIEKQIEKVFDIHNIYYKKSETYIYSEKLYEVLYLFEMEVNTNDE